MHPLSTTTSTMRVDWFDTASCAVTVTVTVVDCRFRNGAKGPSVAVYVDPLPLMGCEPDDTLLPLHDMTTDATPWLSVTVVGTSDTHVASSFPLSAPSAPGRTLPGRRSGSLLGGIPAPRSLGSSVLRQE